MSFTPIKFSQKSTPHVAPLRYVVRGTGERQSTSIQILLRPELAAKGGIRKDEGVRLDIDLEHKLGRLVAIPNERRSFRGKNKGHAMVASWPHNSQLKELFPRVNGEKSAVVPLNVVETSKSEGVIFELPNNEPG
jgi:hypothetical protein